MSLRSFHIVFVTVCTLFSVFLAYWAFVLAPEPSAASTAFGVIGLVGTLVMPIYAILFLHKANKLELP
jgi:Mn2+/Fe2+ NRAMP family transporter